ncbi:MAG: hypothetical protein IKM31_06620 [Oscillospiraceae bacterium]|nr:hypothetical protein [Oscillospiraceae bacterium]
MKTYRYSDAPLEVHGLPFFGENGILERIPAHTREEVPSLAFLGRRCPGARICFRTDSPTVTVKMEFETLTPDIGMSIYSCQAAYVMIGERKTARYAGLVCPPDYQTKTAEKTFEKSKEMEEVVIWLPRNEIIADFSVTVEDGAKVEAPTPYRYPAMLYYGSSITEGGCCSRVDNAYNALISRHLDVDYVNFGFSASAKGEPAMAKLIADIPMSIFVLDYDHNANTPELLEATHEPFFRIIREKNPDLPIVILTRPDFDYDPASPRRREIIRATYENAVKSGDKNVWFIDGENFFGEKERHACTFDCCHPNDLGFYRMAAVIEPVVKAILEERYPEL